MIAKDTIVKELANIGNILATDNAHMKRHIVILNQTLNGIGNELHSMNKKLDIFETINQTKLVKLEREELEGKQTDINLLDISYSIDELKEEVVNEINEIHMLIRHGPKGPEWVGESKEDGQKQKQDNKERNIRGHPGRVQASDKVQALQSKVRDTKREQKNL